jgi:hypothetical protein
MFKFFIACLCLSICVSACYKDPKLELLADSYDKNTALLEIQYSSLYNEVSKTHFEHILLVTDSIELLGQKLLSTIEQHGLCHYDSFQYAIHATIEAQKKIFANMAKREHLAGLQSFSQYDSMQSVYYQQSLNLSKAAGQYKNCSLRQLAFTMFKYGEKEIILNILDFFWSFPLIVEDYKFPMAFTSQNSFKPGDTIHADISLVNFSFFPHDYQHPYYANENGYRKKQVVSVNGDTISVNANGSFVYQHDGTERLLDIKTSFFDPTCQKTIVQNYAYKLQ